MLPPNLRLTINVDDLAWAWTGQRWRTPRAQLNGARSAGVRLRGWPWAERPPSRRALTTGSTNRWSANSRGAFRGERDPDVFGPAADRAALSAVPSRGPGIRDHWPERWCAGEAWCGFALTGPTWSGRRSRWGSIIRPAAEVTGHIRTGWSWRARSVSRLAWGSRRPAQSRRMGYLRRGGPGPRPPRGRGSAV